MSSGKRKQTNGAEPATKDETICQKAQKVKNSNFTAPDQPAGDQPQAIKKLGPWH